jgi:glycerophosphoryl diester phosphodiesterase
MNRHLVGLVASGAIVLGSALSTQPAVAAPQVAGHRGATGVVGHPEESLKAIGYAATYGATWVEGDVKFTADNYAVMLHDKTLDRTTDCTGPVSAVTMAQLRECAPHTVVPQLLFWLRETKRLGLSVNIEIPNPITAHQIEVVRRTIVTEAPDEVIVASWYPEPLEMAKAALGDRVKVAPIIGPTGSPFGYSVAEHAAQFDVILADYRWMIVDRMHWYADAGVAVHLWTASTPESITRTKALAGAEPATSVIIADDVRKVTGL